MTEVAQKKRRGDNTPRMIKEGRQKAFSVAEYLEWQVNLCGKSQAEIAKEAGFNSPNVITMLKKGTTKVPFERLGPLAQALEVDPIHLYKLCMAEYQPETWKTIERLLGQPVLTDNELEILNVIRESSVENPKIRTQEDRMRVLDAINSLHADNARPD